MKVDGYLPRYMRYGKKDEPYADYNMIAASQFKVGILCPRLGAE